MFQIVEVDRGRITLVDPSGITIGISGNPIAITGLVNILAESLPLPSGAASDAVLITLSGILAKETTLGNIYSIISTATLQTSGNVSLNNIDTKVATETTLDNIYDIVATTALQASGNLSVGSIDSKLPAKGQADMAGSMPVVLASDQSTIPTFISGVSTATLQISGISYLTSIDNKIATESTLGDIYDIVSTTALQASGNISLSNIDSKLVNGTIIGDVNAIQKGTWSINDISGIITLPTGAATESTLLSISGLVATEETLSTIYDFMATSALQSSGNLSLNSIDTKVATQETLNNIYGIVSTYALQTSGNVSLSSLDNKLPVQGQTTMSASVPVTIASDHTQIPVSDICNAGGVHGAITVGTSAVEAIVGASGLVGRKYLSIYHNGSATIYWGMASDVTSSTGSPLVKAQYITMPVGQNTHVWLISASAGQNVRIVEMA